MNVGGGRIHGDPIASEVMIEVRTASDSEIAVWSAGWQQRLQRWYGSFGASSAWVANQVRRKTAIPDGATRQTYVLSDDGVFVGFLTVRVAPYGPATVAGIVDVCVASAHWRRGGTAARKWAEQWARSKEQPLLVVTNPADEASLALFSEYPSGLPDHDEAPADGRYAAWRHREPADD
jgi:hypothetical protein